MTRRFAVVTALLFALTASTATQPDQSASPPASVGAANEAKPGVGAASVSQSSAADPDQSLLNQYCLGCHNQRTRSGNFVLASLDLAAAGDHPEMWERVVRKLRGGLMPPVGAPRPDEAAYARFLATLQDRLDAPPSITIVLNGTAGFAK